MQRLRNGASTSPQVCFSKTARARPLAPNSPRGCHTMPRCRLQNGICDMGGVEAAESGYYLVKGTFFPPRLDVVGYADRVDWDSLVAQIIAVTREKGVVVE